MLIIKTQKKEVLKLSKMFNFNKWNIFLKDIFILLALFFPLQLMFFGTMPLEEGDMPTMLENFKIPQNYLIYFFVAINKAISNNLNWMSW